MAKYCECCSNFYSIDSFKKGAKVRFRELPVRIAAELRLLIDEDFTIKDVLFKVNNLGEVMMVVELDQLPGTYFSPNILIVKDLKATPVNKTKDNTFRELIEDNITLRSENSYLRNTLNHAFRGNFEK